MKEADAGRIVGARTEPFSSIEDLKQRARLGTGTLSRLAEADAFGSLDLTRRQASWGIRAPRDTALPLFAAADERDDQWSPEMPEAPTRLKPAPAGREVVDDYTSFGFSLKAHPVAFLRPALDRRNVVRAADIDRVWVGRRVRTAGLVLVRQRPGSAKGVMFITLEDETGPSNLIVWPSLFERFRRVVFSAGMMGVAGRLQREGIVTHVIAERLVDLSAALARVGERDAVRMPTGRGDGARCGGGADQRGLARALGIRTKEDFNPDLLARPERTIEVRPRNFGKR